MWPAPTKMGRSERRFIETSLVSLAVIVLLCGSLIYVIDRPPGSAPLFAFIASGQNDSLLLGAIGWWLPSFAHTFSFSLLTSIFVPANKTNFMLTCFGWLAVNVLFEIGQHSTIAPFLAEQLIGIPAAGRYFLSGTYDRLDIGFAIAGAMAAFSAMVLVQALDAHVSKRARQIARSYEG